MPDCRWRSVKFLIMIRRWGGIVAGLIVLTFSFSGWTNVCVGMSQSAASQSASHLMDAHSGHGAGSNSKSHHDTDTGSKRCQHLSSCTGLTLAPVSLRQAPDANHPDRLFLLAQSAPSSQSPDLEPPPPKA
jgi:hypothetical protein